MAGPRMPGKAVLVIDMLEEFVRGRLRAEAAEEIVPNIARLLDAAREKKVPVIYAVDTHYPDIDFETKLWGPHAIKGSPEREIVEELKPREGDYVVEKRRYDAFFSTDLDVLLRELGVGTLVLTGIHTHICVLATAMGAFYRGYAIVVPRECVAAATKEWHEWGLKYMESFLGAKVTSLEEVLASL